MFPKGSPVKSFKAKRFPGDESKHAWLVLFCIRKSEACQRLAPFWEKLAVKAKAGLVYRVGAVDCNKERSLCRSNSPTPPAARAVLLAAGTRAAAEEDDGGDFSDVIHVGMWEYECLYTMMFVLACRVDVSALPPVTPSLHCVHVAALYQGVVSVVTGIAQVFRV